MAFQRPKKREPIGEAGLFEYAVAALARRMRTVRDLRRLMKTRAEEGAEGERAMDAVVARLVELKYLSDERFAQDYTRLRKEGQKFGRRRVQQDLAQKGVGKELAAVTLAAAYDDEDEVALARAYVARKRMKPPEGTKEEREKQTVRTMNRLLRAGFGSKAIFMLLRSWRVEVDEARIAEDEEAGYELPEF